MLGRHLAVQRTPQANGHLRHSHLSTSHHCTVIWQKIAPPNFNLWHYERSKNTEGEIIITFHREVQSSFILHTFVLKNSNVISYLPWSWNDWLLPSVHASLGSMFPDVTTHAICGLRNSENQWACGENTVLTAKHLANKQLALSPVFSSGSTDVEATAGFLYFC